MASENPPQAFISSYAPRLRTYANSLLTPVIQPTTALAAPLSRTTKRGTTAINYAEDGYEDYDDDDDDYDGMQYENMTILYARSTTNYHVTLGEGVINFRGK